MKFFLKINLIFLLSGCTSTRPYFAQGNSFQLVEPMIVIEEDLFEDEIEVKLQLDLEGAKIYYTLDESEPTEQSLMYKEPFILSKSTVVSAKAFHKDILPSSTVSKYIKKVQKLVVKNCDFSAMPDKKYAANGCETLFDFKKGTANFKDGRWLGFSEREVQIIVELEKTIDVGIMQFSFFSSKDAWIFVPEKINCQLAGVDKKFNEGSIYINDIPQETDFEYGFNNYYISPLKKEVKWLKITITNFPTIPDWHPGKGTPPWLFLDEIIIN